MSDSSTPKSPSWGRRIETLLLLLGVVLFVYLLGQIGAAAVGANLLLIGWGFTLVIGQEILAYLFNTLGWKAAFPEGDAGVSFAELLAARIAGDAINNLTPTATMGGEVVRARMLQGRIDSTLAWASVAIAKITQSVGQVFFILLGLGFVLTDTPLPHGVRRGLFVLLSLFALALLVAVVTQRRGFFGGLARFLSAFGMSFTEERLRRIRSLDAQISSFYQTPGGPVRSVGYFVIGWAMGVVEIYLILYFLELDPTWRRALTVEVLSMAIDAALFFVPAKAGTQEGGKVLIFSILGMPAAKGLALGIARRIREMFWALIGLAILTYSRSARAAVVRRSD